MGKNLQQGMVDYWVAQSVLASPQSPSLNLSVGFGPADNMWHSENAEYETSPQLQIKSDLNKYS
jgi:hypothetical protein